MILGFSLDRVSGSRADVEIRKVEARNTLKIVDVAERSLEPLSKEKVLRLAFVYTVSYEPGVGGLELRGGVLYQCPEEGRKALLEGWRKGQKLDPGVGRVVFNYLLGKCSVAALGVAEGLGLPPHIPFPRVSKKEK